MLFRSFLVLVSASLSTLYVVAAQDDKRKPENPHYPAPEEPDYGEPAPEPSQYPEPEPSWIPSPSQWEPPIPEPTSWPPNPEPTWAKPTEWVPNPPVPTPTPWQSSTLVDPNPTWEPQPTVKEPTWIASEPQPTPLEPLPTPSGPKPQQPPPNNAPPVEPERYSRPFSKCYSGKNRNYYSRGFKSGKKFVKILLHGYDDCAESGHTIHILQQSAPYYPSASHSSPSLYCRNLGYYRGFVWAVDKFEKKCTWECKDDGQTIGHDAGMLLCNLPTVRRLAVDVCSRSFKAGCALEFDKVVRDNCPKELNGPRYQQIKSTVCVL